MYQYYPSGFGNLPIAGATPPQVQPGAAYFVQADPASRQQACPLETGFLIISSAPVYLTFCRLFYLQISAYILSAPARHAVMQCFGHLLIRVHSQPAFAFPHAKAGMMPARVQICIFLNVQLGEAAKRNVGTGANQIPDMSAFDAQLALSGYAKEPSGLIRQWVGGNTGGMVAGETKVIELPFPFPSGILAVVPYTGALAPGFTASVGIKWSGKNQITLYNSSMTTAIADYGFIAYGR